MKTLYKIKKGLDLTLKGEAVLQLAMAQMSDEYDANRLSWNSASPCGERR